MKNVKYLLMFITISACLFASAQRVNSLGGNVGYWPDDDNAWTYFPHTINNSNLAQVSGLNGSNTEHKAIVRWGEGTKWGFTWDQAQKNDMVNLQYGNGAWGATFGLSMSGDDDGDDTNGKATAGMGLSGSYGMVTGFGDIGVAFANSSYDDGVTGNDDPASMGLSFNLRRAQSLWIFDNMLVSFAHRTDNTYESNGMNSVKDGATWMNLGISLYKHIAIADNTTGLLAMGFGYGSQAGAIIDDGSCSNNALTFATCESSGANWTSDYTGVKDYAKTMITLPSWTFAVESAMTDWATARVGVTSGYNLSTTTNSGATGAKDATSRGGSGAAEFSFGLGFNYGSFNLDVSIDDDLFTNPVQHVVGFTPLDDTEARATLTYSW